MQSNNHETLRILCANAFDALFDTDDDGRCLRLHATEIVAADGSRRLVDFRTSREHGPGEHLITVRELARGPLRGAPLTAREREVLQLAADGGGSTSEIAKQLVVSSGTVKTHFEHAYQKLGVRDRAAAVAEGMRRGLIA